MTFQGVKYHLSTTLPRARRAELARILREHHAIRADSVFNATYIITNSEVFEGSRDIDAEKVSIVSDLWVEHSIASQKIQPACYYSVSPSKLFSGVIACSADLHPSDEEVLAAGITGLGGQWRINLSNDVTHLFFVSKMSKDYRTAMAYRDTRHIKVLVPDWFDDTILLDTRDLSTNTYEWEHPEMIERRPNSTTLQQNGVTHPKRVTPSQPQMEIKDVWSGRRILLSTSLVLTGFRRRILDDWILKCRGVPIQYISNGGDGLLYEELNFIRDGSFDVFITRYRTGKAFFKVWDTGKTIGTLSWLLDMQATGLISGPRDRILHFPTPPGTVKDFDKHKIAITNYTGEAREYLKKLIAVMGGEFTAHLNIQNTVLVAAHLGSPKTVKAAEWSIPIVNHTWLEDCVLRWQNLTPAHPDYTSYPPGVDLGVKVGERSVGHDIEEIVDAEAMRLGSFYW